MDTTVTMDTIPSVCHGSTGGTAEMVSQKLISFECYFKHLWMVIIRIPTANGKVKERKGRIAIVSRRKRTESFQTP